MRRRHDVSFGALRALLHAQTIDYEVVLDVMEQLYLEDSVEYAVRWMPCLKGVLASRGVACFVLASVEPLESSGALVPMGEPVIGCEVSLG